jgi:hypothetical protein
MVLPYFFANLLNIWIMLYAIWLSSPEVGSSNISKSGFVTIYTAMHTLFFSPPEIPFMNFPPT